MKWEKFHSNSVFHFQILPHYCLLSIRTSNKKGHEEEEAEGGGGSEKEERKEEKKKEERRSTLTPSTL